MASSTQSGSLSGLPRHLWTCVELDDVFDVPRNLAFDARAGRARLRAPDNGRTAKCCRRCKEELNLPFVRVSSMHLMAMMHNHQRRRKVHCELCREEIPVSWRPAKDCEEWSSHISEEQWDEMRIPHYWQDAASDQAATPCNPGFLDFGPLCDGSRL